MNKTPEAQENLESVADLKNSIILRNLKLTLGIDTLETFDARLQEARNRSIKHRFTAFFNPAKSLQRYETFQTFKDNIEALDLSQYGEQIKQEFHTALEKEQASPESRIKTDKIFGIFETYHPLNLLLAGIPGIFSLPVATAIMALIGVVAYATGAGAVCLAIFLGISLYRKHRIEEANTHKFSLFYAKAIQNIEHVYKITLSKNEHRVDTTATPEVRTPIEGTFDSLEAKESHLKQKILENILEATLGLQSLEDFNQKFEKAKNPTITYRLSAFFNPSKSLARYQAFDKLRAEIMALSLQDLENYPNLNLEKTKDELKSANFQKRDNFHIFDILIVTLACVLATTIGPIIIASILGIAGYVAIAAAIALVVFLSISLHQKHCIERSNAEALKSSYQTIPGSIQIQANSARAAKASAQQDADSAQKWAEIEASLARGATADTATSQDPSNSGQNGIDLPSGSDLHATSKTDPSAQTPFLNQGLEEDAKHAHADHLWATSPGK